jgi:hypothetical protein
LPPADSFAALRSAALGLRARARPLAGGRLVRTARPVHELEDRELGRIAHALAQLQHARVATGALAEALGQVAEDAGRDIAATDHPQRAPARVERAALAERDHALGDAPHFLRLGVRGLDPPVL